MAHWIRKQFSRWKTDSKTNPEALIKSGRTSLGNQDGRVLSGTHAFNHGQLELPDQPNRPYSTVGAESQVPFDYYSRLHNATLDQCVITVFPWRQYNGGYGTESPPVHLVLTSLLKPGSESLTHVHSSYSYDIFIKLTELKINREPGQEPTDMRFGRLGYFDYNQDWNTVNGQDDFEIALSKLYMIRDFDNVLKMIFQPEGRDDRASRLYRERKNALERPQSKNFFGMDGRDEGVDAVLEDDRIIRWRATDELTSKPTPGTEIGEDKPFLLDHITGIETPPHTPPKFRISQHSLSPSESAGRTSASRASTLETSVRRYSQLLKGESSRARDVRWTKSVVVTKKSAFKRGGQDELEEGDLDATTIPNDALEDTTIISSDESEDDEFQDTVNRDANRIVAKLQSLIDLPELTQFNTAEQPGDHRWQECCQIFNIDPTRTSISETVYIAGLRTKIYQYQAFGVYWQMVTSRKLGGGFLADSMGLGKTLSFLAFFVVERQLCVLWNDVERSRAVKDGKHLLPEDQHSNDMCPSSRKSGWISCPCASSNPTSKLAQKPGVRLACVPNELVKSWWNEWKKHVDDRTESTILGLKIAINYPGAFDTKTVSEDMNRKAGLPVNVKRLKMLESASAKKEFHHSGWLIVSSAAHFKPLLDKEFKSSRNGSRKYQIEFGLAMIDESHEEYFKQTGRSKILCELPADNQPFLWGYSGTPFSQTPRGLEGVLWAIEQQVPSLAKGINGWNNHPILKDFQWKTLDKICNDFDTQIKSGKSNDAEVDRVIAKFKPFLQNFVIRRTADTKWFGHRLIKLKAHCHQDTFVDLSDKTRSINYSTQIAEYERQFQHEKDDALAELQAKWDKFPEKRRTPEKPNQLAFNTRCRLEWRLRIFSTLPFLVNLTLNSDPKEKIDLTVDETLSFFRRPGEKIKENPYFRHIRNIAEDSPKLLFVYNLIKTLDTKRDYNGDEQKLIIISSFPQVVFSVYMFILKYLPKRHDRVGVILPRMKAKERTDILEAFAAATDDKGRRKQKGNNQILIGTTRLIGKGLQLTRAAHLVLMEPDYEFVNELQAYGRIHRIGQKNPCSYSFRLISTNSEIENRIVDRQIARKEVVGRELDDVELEGLWNRQGSVLDKTV